MKKIQTKLQQKSEAYPTRLEWLRELNKRRTLGKELEDELFRLERGHAGEQKVLEIIEKYGDPNWLILQNLWLRYFGNFECDMLLLTNYGLQTIEIKNYSGNYEYRHSQFLLDGISLGHNPISQSQRAFINLRKILQDHSIHIPIQGSLVFTGENCDITISDPVAELEILMLHQLSSYIRSLRDHEPNPLINRTEVLKLLEAFETESPFVPEPLTDEMEQNLQRGIMCSQCHSFQIEIRSHEVRCKCSAVEPRENAIVRTICEYGVLHFEKKLELNQLVQFFGGQVSRTNLLKYLLKYFNKIYPNKNTVFINKPQPFIKRIDSFHLAKKVIRRVVGYK